MLIGCTVYVGLTLNGPVIFGYITTCCMYRAPIAVVEAPAVALYSWHLWCAADLHVDVGMCRAMQMVTPCWML